MIRRLMPLIACAAALGAAAPAIAKDEFASEFRQIRAGEPVTLRADRAYVLLRIDTDLAKFSAQIMRVPDEAELLAYDEARKQAHARAGKKAGPIASFSFEYEGRPNYFGLAPGKAIAPGAKMATVLAEISPGDYVFYGMGMNGFLHQCFCLGTVGFNAEAGRVIDLGTLLIAKAWQPSPIPELKDEANLGRSAVMDYGLFAAALRPATADTSLPTGVQRAATSPARFHAVGPFIEPNALLITRLAAMPGVLAYDQGKVIDAATGKEMPPG
jgi:hypothetical protein